MPACSQCNVEVAPSEVYLTSSGPVCNRCHAAAEAKGADKIFIGAPGFDSDSPEKRMLKGAAVFGVGLAGTVVLLVFPPTHVISVYSFLPLFLLPVGLAMFARGLQLRPRRRR